MRGSLFAVALCAAFALVGCGSVRYTVSLNAARAKLEQARALGAESEAPFEYYYATEHFQQAQREAAEASYGDAMTFADTAAEYAQKAIDRAQVARGRDATTGGGRAESK